MFLSEGLLMKKLNMLSAALCLGMPFGIVGCGDGSEVATMSEDDKQKFESSHKQAGDAAAASGGAAQKPGGDN